MEKGFEHPWKSVWLVFLKFAWKGHHDAYWKHVWNFGTYSMLIAHLSPCFLKVILTMGEKKRNYLSVWQLTTCILSLYSRKWTYLINAGRNSKIVMFFSSRRFFRKMNRRFRYFYLKTMIEFLSESKTGNFIRR